MGRGLADVLDGYLEPSSAPRTKPGARIGARIFVPLLDRDALCARLAAALAGRLRALGIGCTARARDARAGALLAAVEAEPPEGEPSPLALELGVEPAQEAEDSVLLFLLPGWEARAALAAGPDPASPARPVCTVGSGDDGVARWRLAALGLAPHSLGHLPADGGLSQAVGLARERSIDPIARQLAEWSRR